MKKILKFLSYVLVIRIVFNLFNENTTIKEQIDKLKDCLLYTSDAADE